MGLQASGFRELEQHRLGKLVGMQVGCLLGLAQAVDEGLRPDHPAHPQARETHLGKAAKQDGAAVFIQLLDGRQRLAFVAQIAIGVVLDHRHARRARRLEHLAPGRQRQGCARGVLEIRGHHQEARPLALQHALQLRDIQPFRAHRNAHKLSANSGQQVLQARVDGVLDRYRVAGPQHHAADEVERLLTAIGDDQIVAGTRQVLAARLFHEVAAQGLETRGRAQLQDAGQVLPRQHRRATGAEFIQRKQRARRPRHLEADDFAAEPRGRPARMSRGRHIAALEQRIPIDPAGAQRAPCHRVPRHETAAAHLAGDQPFGFEHFVRRRDGGTIQSKQASQFASGW